MVENVKLRQTIAKMDFLRIFQQKSNFWENLTSGCHGYKFVGVASKSTNLAKITLLVSMETWSLDNSNNIKQTRKETFSHILQKTALEYLNSNQIKMTALDVRR